MYGFDKVEILKHMVGMYLWPKLEVCSFLI